MSSSDDEMPPPLEDMSEQIEKAQKKKEAFSQALGHTSQTDSAGLSNPGEDDVEETRLGPPKKTVSQIMPTEDKPITEIASSTQKSAQPKPAAAKAPATKKD